MKKFLTIHACLLPYVCKHLEFAGRYSSVNAVPVGLLTALRRGVRPFLPEEADNRFSILAIDMTNKKLIWSSIVLDRERHRL